MRYVCTVRLQPWVRGASSALHVSHTPGVDSFASTHAPLPPAAPSVNHMQPAADALAHAEQLWKSLQRAAGGSRTQRSL